MDAINTEFDEFQIGLLCEKYKEEGDESIVLSRDAFPLIHEALRAMNKRVLLTDVTLSNGFDLDMYNETTNEWTQYFEEVKIEKFMALGSTFLPVRYTSTKVIMFPIGSGPKTMYMLDISRYPPSMSILPPMSTKMGNEWNYVHNSFTIAVQAGRRVFLISRFGDVSSINIDTMKASRWEHTSGYPTLNLDSMFMLNNCTVIEKDGDVIIYIMAGYADPANPRLYFKYAHSTKMFTNIAPPPVDDDIMRFACTLLGDGNILLTGGRNKSSTTTYAHAFEYNPHTDTWITRAPLLQARSYHTSALLQSGDVMMMCGELGDGSLTQTCEIYDCKKNEWRSAAACGKHMFYQSIASGVY